MSEQDKEKDKPAAAAPKKEGGGIIGLLVNGIGIFVLSLGAVIVGGIVDHKLHPPQEFEVDAGGKLTIKKPPQPVGEPPAEAKPTLYLALDPPLIVNFPNTDALRLMQVTITVMAHEQSALDAVTKYNPLIRNNLITLMSGRDSQSLMTREGKEKLRQEALKEVQAVLKKQNGAPGIEDLLFTSFVVQ
jgi:flagellar FliL protein